MSAIITGVLIGMGTSFIAGVLLIWKGEQIVERFRRLPAKRQVELYSRAYILALRSYPYRLIHLSIVGVVGGVLLVVSLAYGLFSYALFKTQFAGQDLETLEAIRSVFGAAPGGMELMLRHGWR